MQFCISNTVHERVAVTQGSLLIMARISQLISPSKEHFAQVLSRFRIPRALGEHLPEVAGCHFPAAVGGLGAGQVVKRVSEFRIQFERPPKLLLGFDESRRGCQRHS